VPALPPYRASTPPCARARLNGGWRLCPQPLAPRGSMRFRDVNQIAHRLGVRWSTGGLLGAYPSDELAPTVGTHRTQKRPLCEMHKGRCWRRAREDSFTEYNWKAAMPGILPKGRQPVTELVCQCRIRWPRATWPPERGGVRRQSEHRRVFMSLSDGFGSHLPAWFGFNVRAFA
jgi:hypothetical protein